MGRAGCFCPALLREKADLKGDVAVVGTLDRLEIRNTEEYRKQVRRTRSRLSMMKRLRLLGI